MKYLTTLLMLIFSTGCLFAQQGIPDTIDWESLSKKEQRQLRKEIKKQQDLENLEVVKEILESRQWILEADMLFDRGGQSYIIQPNINFFGVNEEEAALQLAFQGLVGWNGIGGVTIEGQVGTYEIDKRSKGSPSLRVRFRGRGGVGSADITMTINSDFRGRAMISGDFGERLTLQGRLVPLALSGVYKGQAIF